MNDPDLQRAMAMSMGQPLPEQESGVTGAGQQFGPATRSHYDMSQWALAPVTSSREMIEHPEPMKRKRVQGQPAFLRGSKETGYLGALLTIYHGIPLAREALLLPSMHVGLYGYDPSWWSGSTDENRKSLSIEVPPDNDHSRLNFLAEVQCLMAFLDNTNRAYGSIDALSNIHALRSFNAESDFARFLQYWTEAALKQLPSEQLTQIFSSTAMKANIPEDSPPLEKSLVCLEPPVSRIEGQLLVEMLDNTVWNDNTNYTNNIDDVWLQHCAEVFTMRIFDPAEPNQGIGLTITPTWYPDRYMYDCRALSMEMRKEVQSLRKEINQCAQVQRRCDFIQTPDRRTLRVREILDAAAKASTSVVTDKSNSSNSIEKTRPDDDDPHVTTGDVQALQTNLLDILNRIDQKIAVLEKRKADLRTQMKKVALQLTQPSEDTSKPPHMKYVLQGVSTQSNIVYVRRPVQSTFSDDVSDDVNDDEEEMSKTSDVSWQWWRISWSQDGQSFDSHSQSYVGPITQAEADKNTNSGNAHDLAGSTSDSNYSIRMVTENDVIDAVKTEHHSVVLVYANENAIHFTGHELSLSLKRFVDQDNQTFAQELTQQLGIVEGELSPDSETDLTMHAPLSDPAIPSNPVREMTPMSMSSSPRDEDGQPSPKRPKSAEEHNFQSIRDQPPAYDEVYNKPEMQEKKGNKIGLYAEQMLEKYGQVDYDHNEPSVSHVERPEVESD